MQRFDELLSAIAAKQPAPGGGAVASMLGAIGAALAEMVVQYSRGRANLAGHASLHEDVLGRLIEIRGRALQLAEEDRAAYARLNELQRLPKDDPKRASGWTAAVDGAIAAPRACLELACDLLKMCESLVGRSNDWLRSDLAIAAIAAEAAASSAAWNVRINLPLVDDEQRRSGLEDEMAQRVSEARSQRDRIESACQ